MNRVQFARLDGPVTRFALYGETPGTDDPEFVHIEDIQIRSSRYGWHIAPHMHRRMFQIIFLIDGPAVVQLEDAHQEVQSPCAICIPGNIVHGFDFTDESIGFVVTVSERLLLDVGRQGSPAYFDVLLTEARIVPFEQDEKDIAFAATLLRQLSCEFQARAMGRNAMFEWLLHALLMMIRRQLAVQSDSDDGKGAGREKFAEVCRLIEDRYREHLPVSTHAGQLAMTQARLNRLCRRFSGKTFSELLHDRLALEAQRYLIYTSATVEMIAYELGYADPGYFCRFFKRRTGKTPGAFRRERQAAA